MFTYSTFSRQAQAVVDTKCPKFAAVIGDSKITDNATKNSTMQRKNCTMQCTVPAIV